MKQTLEFLSQPEDLAGVRAFVRRFLSDLTLSAKEAELLVLGIDEACTNIIRHAYRNAGKKPIHLSCECWREQLRFTLRDFGRQIEAAKLQGRSLDEIQPGGLGIFLIHQAFDEVAYQPKSRGTELVLTKMLSREVAPSSNGNRWN
ncbi:MAG TPA: ATP-binding protein [Chthoniobacteraceae bacterium]|nr:ATP-binding protein [Chthoniobacteraceae bacterium]